jgi:hypothetical protein
MAFKEYVRSSQSRCEPMVGHSSLTGLGKSSPSRDNNSVLGNRLHLPADARRDLMPWPTCRAHIGLTKPVAQFGWITLP